MTNLRSPNLSIEGAKLFSGSLFLYRHQICKGNVRTASTYVVKQVENL